MAGVRLRGTALVVAMCVGQVANLLSHVVVPGVMAQYLIPLWNLSAAEAGVMASAYSVGYMLAVPLLMTLTDRYDARLILLGGSALMGAATIAFGVLASGLISATLLWALAGIGCAGAYMPGLRALTDRLEPGDNSRSITLYTACFSLGVGLSFLAAQVLAGAFGWRMAFVLTGAAPAIMIAVCFMLEPVRPPAGKQKLLDFRPVVANRTALGYIIGYGIHCFELYGFRTWIVAFWSYIVARSDGRALLDPIAVSVIITLIAVPASILGNEGALRFGRHRSIAAVMSASAFIALAIAACIVVTAPFALLVLLIAYAFTLPGDSGALTSGMALSAHPAERGATMALHSMAGFGMAALGGTAVGLVIDLFGGPGSDGGWVAAFIVMGTGIATGPLALAWSRRGAATEASQPPATTG